MNRKNSMQSGAYNRSILPVMKKEFINEFNKNTISADLQKSCETAEEIFKNDKIYANNIKEKDKYHE